MFTKLYSPPFSSRASSEKKLHNRNMFLRGKRTFWYKYIVSKLQQNNGFRVFSSILLGIPVSFCLILVACCLLASRSFSEGGLHVSSISPAYASEAYTSSYSATYTVSDSGMTHADLTVSLTNNTTENYATSYRMDVGFNDLQHFKARDSKGALTPIVTKLHDGGYTVLVQFNDKVVGKGNTLTFHLSFDTGDIAKKDGTVWELHIPGIAKQADFSDYTVKVAVPESFGPPSLIKPATAHNTLTFTKKELGTAGIAITFGDYQLYSFILTYHLKNSNVYSTTEKIALPPTTNYQTVAISSLYPRPLNVTKDLDGNWLAVYSLPPSSRLDVTAKGVAKVAIAGQKEALSVKQRKMYLAETMYWQTSNSEIKKLAGELKTPENIYDYLIDHLEYDFSRVTQNKPRAGAAEVLRTPKSSVCLEFTDLFIALARSAGIPSREVDGYAFSRNNRERPLSLVKDLLHAWPEYYDAQNQTWVMVDPTWGKTTGGMDYFHSFDSDHVAFVVKGVDSSIPLPAGLYKLEGDQQKKDVSVTFATTFPRDERNLDVVPEPVQTTLSGIPITTSFRVKNIGFLMSPAAQAIITSSALRPARQTIAIPSIPPYGYIDVPITFQSTPFLTSSTYPFTILVADATLDQQLKVTPFIFTRWTIRGGIVLVLFTIIIFTIAFKARRIPLFRRR